MPYASDGLITFDGAQTPVGAPFDGFSQINVFGSPVLRRSGSGGVVIEGTPDFHSYAYKAASSTRMLFRARVRFKTGNDNFEYLVGARFTGNEAGAGWYQGYHASLYSANGGSLRLTRNGGNLLSPVGNLGLVDNNLYDIYIETLPGTVSGTKVVAYVCNTFQSIENPLGTVSFDNETTAALQAVGSVFFAHSDGLSTPKRYGPGWEILEAETYSWVEETAPPYIGSGVVAGDGSGFYLRFVDSGVSPDSGVTGFTFEGRVGSGSYSVIPTGNGAKVPGSSFTYFFPTTGGYVVPKSFTDVRCIYNQATGNLVDTSPNANELASGTYYLANESLMQAATRTGDRPMILATRGWCRVEPMAGTEGMEGQTSREIYYPYGAAAGTAKVVFQGFTTGTGVVRLKSAGVRIVSPGGVVTTQTFVAAGSPVDIPLNATVEYTITSAIQPGSVAYPTVMFTEASGGALPYQNQESIAPRNEGAYDGSGAELGSLGTLTHKTLLGGTSSGVGHTIPAGPGSYVVGANQQVRTYNIAFSYGLPHPNLSEDIKVGAILAVGNSTMIGQLSRDTGVMYRAFGYNLDSSARPYIVAGQGGSVYSSGITFLNSTLGQFILGGGVLANALVSLGIEGYGHNDIRADGRLSSPPYGPESLVELLLSQRELVKAPFGNIPVMPWTLTAVDANWAQWDSTNDKFGMRTALQQYNRRLKLKYGNLCIDLATISASKDINNEEGDPYFPGSDLISWDLFYADGIHFEDRFAVACGYVVRAKVDAYFLGAVTGGTGGTGGGTLTVRASRTLQVPVSYFGRSGAWVEVPEVAGKTVLLSASDLPFRFCLSNANPGNSFYGDVLISGESIVLTVSKLWVVGLDSSCVFHVHYEE